MDLIFLGIKLTYFQGRCFCSIWTVDIQSGPFDLHMRPDFAHYLRHSRDVALHLRKGEASFIVLGIRY